MQGREQCGKELLWKESVSSVTAHHGKAQENRTIILNRRKGEYTEAQWGGGGMERNTNFSHELIKSNVVRILPPLFPVCSVIRSNRRITNRSIKLSHQNKKSVSLASEEHCKSKR